MSEVVIQRAVETQGQAPDDTALSAWAANVLDEFNDAREVTIRIVSESEMQALNRDYRGKDQPTNVLSFPVYDEFELEHGVLGDIVICADVVAREARQQHKDSQAHWAHMVMHGVLHLMGFDHIEERQAREMEAHEVRMLAALGFADPYHFNQQENQNV